MSNQINYIKVIGELCSHIHPEAKDEIEAVAAHQKWTQDLIDLKTKHDMDASKDIELFYVLNHVWNILKAEAIKEEEEIK